MNKRENITCEQCEHCMYIEHGDMYCDLTVDVKNKDVKFVYDEFHPIEHYMWCGGKELED